MVKSKTRSKEYEILYLYFLSFFPSFFLKKKCFLHKRTCTFFCFVVEEEKEQVVAFFFNKTK